LSELIFVKLVDFDYPVALFHSQSHLVHFPRTGEGPLLVRGMHAFAGGSKDAYSTQEKNELFVASEWEDRMIQPLAER